MESSCAPVPALALARVARMTSPATKPSVEIPDGPPPTELVVEDLSVGDGPEAAVPMCDPG